MNTTNCWAFVTVTTIEALKWIKTRNLLSLSKQQPVDCDQYDGGCKHGSFHKAFKWIVANGSIITEAEYTNGKAKKHQ